MRTYMRRSSDYSPLARRTLTRQQSEFYNLAINKLPALLHLYAASCALDTARRLLITQLQKASILLFNYACQTIKDTLRRDAKILMVGDWQSTHCTAEAVKPIRLSVINASLHPYMEQFICSLNTNTAASRMGKSFEIDGWMSRVRQALKIKITMSCSPLGEWFYL